MTQRELPVPMVPAEVDLRGYEYMPLYGDRLFKSHTWIKASPEARCAMLRLWWHAYAHEVPAGSLPDDSVFLAEYSGLAANLKHWNRLRHVVMNKWTKCSDGRLYHPVMAQIVMQSWEVKESQRGRTEHARKKRLQNAKGNPASEPSVTDSVTEPVTDNATTPVTESNITYHNVYKHNEDKTKAFARPEWIPEKAWTDYVTMRAKIRKPMTDRAKELAVEKLQELQNQGHAPAAVLEQSTFNSWQGLFAVRGATATVNRQAGVEQRNSTVAENWRP